MSSRPGAKTWGDFFEMLHTIEVPEDFMDERPMNALSAQREVFGDEEP
ncbi:MAG: hypothetical protein ACRER2_04685 [Methylococcales bacterium]